MIKQVQSEKKLFYYTNIKTVHDQGGVVQLPCRAWLVASRLAGVAHPPAIADGIEEAAVAGVAGVAAGQRVTQTRLLVWDTTAWGTHGPALQLSGSCILITGSAWTEARKVSENIAGSRKIQQEVTPTSS